MSDPNKPLPRVCAVCQQVPCYCPDLADECDEQGAEEEARGVSWADFVHAVKDSRKLSRELADIRARMIGGEAVTL